LQTKVKKWFKDKNFGFLENGHGPDIMVRQADLIKCQYLKVGAIVEFECHPDKKGLIAKKVKLSNQTKNGVQQKGGHRNNNANTREPYIGVMT
jgi:cold shock CspA family protein